MDLNVNKKHKDSLFSTLFSTPEVLRELYCAIVGVEIPKNAVININTLSDVLFMRKINDISFTIDDRIVVLIEHQSTINKNIPVRLLMYVARIYEKILEKENLYQNRLIRIPVPEFIVLYNGAAPFPDHKEIKLSETFIKKEGFEIKSILELTANVYNINHGRNSEILQKCETLDGYSFLINLIREYNKELPLEEAMKKAIKYCIDIGVLELFLKEHGSEVINMLTDDITMEELADIRYNEGHEDGWEEGREKAREEERMYFLELLEQGLSIEEIKQRLSSTQTR